MSIQFVAAAHKFVFPWRERREAFFLVLKWASQFLILGLEKIVNLRRVECWERGEQQKQKQQRWWRRVSEVAVAPGSAHRRGRPWRCGVMIDNELNDENYWKTLQKSGILWYRTGTRY